ncbi:tubby-related protein 2 isoform X1 [Symphalangus syndactylus]|uniref:tubby-related protein 2 isoform X1 n=1 Tax=Symphalangus syndactylus TaxID=9590 RepID=UPI002441771B|nr:tubby-related protein 2 isoform X1 [Symphalangus syndactylus]
MSQDNDTLRRDILGHELAAMRLQKLEQQRRLLEKKQRQKRQDLLMVHVNPDACPWRWRSCLRKERLLGDKGLGNAFLLKKVSEAHLPSGIHSALGTVSCGGDGRVERRLLTPRTEVVFAMFRNPGLQSPFLSWLPDNSDAELEEVSMENGSVSPPPFKQSPRIQRKCWQARQRPGTRAEGKSDSQDVGDAYKSPNVGPNPGMDGDWVYENLAFQKEEDLEKKREASESTGTNSSAATNEELSKALKGEGGTDSDHMRHEASLAIRSPCSGLEEDMEAYVLRPALPGTRMQCYLTRDNRSVDNGLFPLYYLYLETSDSLKHFLLAARKSRRSKTSNYLISLDPAHLSRDGNNFVGKVRSNVFRTTFTIFDNGVNPDREHLIRNTARIRRELGAVCYEPNILGYLGPRKMTVILPGTNSQNQRINVRLLNEQESLLSRYHRGDKQGLLLLHNKTPSWNKENGVYMLNFHGRVTRTSVKNFQIMDPNHQEHLVLQFGRVGPDTFTMDFCFPFSPLQAFGICLSSFN